MTVAPARRRLAAQWFLLIVAYYPLLNWLIRKADLPFSTLWEEVVLGGFLVAALITSHRKLIPLLSSPVVVTALLFAAAALFGFALNSYYIGAFVHEARLAFEPFMAFVILWLLVDDHSAELLRWVVPHLIVAASIVAAIGVYQYIRKVPIPAQWLDKDTESGIISTRAFSLFGSPNVLAGYLEMILPLGLYASVAESRPLRRAGLLLCSVVLGSGLLLTLTRAAWLSTAGAFFVGLFLLHPWLGAGFAAAAGVLVMAVPTFRLRMTTLLSPEYVDKSNNLGRLFRWRQAFVNVMGHPLLGSGLGSFGGSAAQKYGYFTGISMDSVWIRVLAETGILGFASYLAWFASAFASVAVRFFRTRDRLWLFTSIGLLALLVNLFTDNLLDSWAISLLVWTLFALGAIPETQA